MPSVTTALFGSVAHSNSVEEMPPDVRSPSIFVPYARYVWSGTRFEWYTHAGRQAETTSKLIIGFVFLREYEYFLESNH